MKFFYELVHECGKGMAQFGLAAGIVSVGVMLNSWQEFSAAFAYLFQMLYAGITNNG